MTSLSGNNSSQSFPASNTATCWFYLAPKQHWGPGLLLKRGKERKSQSFSQSVAKSVWLFATPWAVAHQAPLFMGFSRQEYWSGLPCPPPGDLLDLCSIYKLILCPRASHLATVKMLKLQFGPRQVQRLPSRAHLPISEPPLWVSWCRRNSRLMLGVWTSKTHHGAGYSDFFSLGSGLLSMRQDSLLWWSESLAQWPSMLSPSVSQSQTRLGLCGRWPLSADSLFTSAKNQHWMVRLF